MEILTKWIEFTNKGNDWRPTKWSKICGRHFLASDFIQNSYQNTRKILRKNVVPTVEYIAGGSNNYNHQQKCTSFVAQKQEVEEEFEPEENSQDMNMIGSSNGPLIDRTCRLCGKTSLSEHDLSDCFNRNLINYKLLMKTLPNLTLRADDGLPRKICQACLKQVEIWSSFIDVTLKIQPLLREKFNSNVKIKQEPAIVIKQEILKEQDVSDDEEVSPPELDTAETANYSQEVVEIVQPVEEIDLRELKVEADQYVETILLEHSYSMLGVEGLKTERRDSDEEEEEEEVENDNDECEPNQNEEEEPPPPPPPDDDNSSNILPKCDICNCFFELEDDLTVHNFELHEHSPRTCTNCSATLNTEFDFQQHHTVCPGNIITIADDPQDISCVVIDQHTSIQCNKCYKFLPNKLTFNHHTKYLCEFRRPLTPFYCHHCDEQFERRTLLRKHTDKYHPIVDRVKLQRRQSPPDSIKRTRKGEYLLSQVNGRYPCKLCPRTYGRHSNMLSHMRKHRPPSEWNLECHVCSMTFDRRFDFIKHLQFSSCSFTYYTCTVCQKRYHFRSEMMACDHQDQVIVMKQEDELMIE